MGPLVSSALQERIEAEKYQDGKQREVTVQKKGGKEREGGGNDKEDKEDKGNRDTHTRTRQTANEAKLPAFFDQGQGYLGAEEQY